MAYHYYGEPSFWPEPPEPGDHSSEVLARCPHGVPLDPLEMADEHRRAAWLEVHPEQEAFWRAPGAYAVPAYTHDVQPTILGGRTP